MIKIKREGVLNSILLMTSFSWNPEYDATLIVLIHIGFPPIVGIE